MPLCGQICFCFDEILPGLQYISVPADTNLISRCLIILSVGRVHKDEKFSKAQKRRDLSQILFIGCFTVQFLFLIMKSDFKKFRPHTMWLPGRIVSPEVNAHLTTGQ